MKIEYFAKDVGIHKVEVINNGAPLFKKPLFIEVCDPSKVKVTNVQDGVVGREQQFRGLFLDIFLFLWLKIFLYKI